MRDDPDMISLRRTAPVEIEQGGAPPRPGYKPRVPSPRVTFFRVAALALLMGNAIPILLCAFHPLHFKVPAILYGFALLLVGWKGSGLVARHSGPHPGMPWSTWRWFLLLLLAGVSCLVGVFLVLNPPR